MLKEQKKANGENLLKYP